MNIPIKDDNDLAKKALRKSQAHSDVSAHSTDASEGLESISTPARPFGGTLNEWRVYIRHYTVKCGGSVGANVTAKGVYIEIDLKINVLNA